LGPQKNNLRIRPSLCDFDYLFYSEKSFLTQYFTIICKMSLSLVKKFTSTRADGIIYTFVQLDIVELENNQGVIIRLHGTAQLIGNVWIFLTTP
jgi:hypothetical protein